MLHRWPLALHKDIEARMTKKLIEEGYSVQTNVRLSKGYEADILAHRNSETHLIEIKRDRKTAISALVDGQMRRYLPKILTVSLALPSEELEDDIIEISRTLGFGVYSVSPSEIQLKVKPIQLPQGELSSGGSFPGSVAAGQTFSIRFDLIARQRIFSNAKVSFLIGDPFFIPDGETVSKTIDEVLPEKTEPITLKVGISKDATPGKYLLFIERRADGIPEYITNYPIEVKKESDETILQDVRNSIGVLDAAITTNLESSLRRIQDAMLRGTIDIHNSVLSDSAWTELGNYCLKNGLFRQAQSIYENMLKTIGAWEEEHRETLHKGVAFYNLGVALYYQGKSSEAKSSFEKSCNEDKRTYGESEAEGLPAKMTLQKLFKEP